MGKFQKLITSLLLIVFVVGSLAMAIAMFLGNRGPRPVGAMEAFKVEHLEERLASTDPTTREAALMAAIIHGPNLTNSQVEAVVALGLDGRFPSGGSVALWQRAIVDNPEMFERVLARGLAERMERSATATIYLAAGLETLQLIDEQYASVDLSKPDEAIATLQEILSRD